MYQVLGNINLDLQDMLDHIKIHQSFQCHQEQNLVVCMVKRNDVCKLLRKMCLVAAEDGNRGQIILWQAVEET